MSPTYRYDTNVVISLVVMFDWAGTVECFPADLRLTLRFCPAHFDAAAGRQLVKYPLVMVQAIDCASLYF